MDVSGKQQSPCRAPHSGTVLLRWQRLTFWSCWLMSPQCCPTPKCQKHRYNSPVSGLLHDASVQHLQQTPFVLSCFWLMRKKYVSLCMRTCMHPSVHGWPLEVCLCLLLYAKLPRFRLDSTLWCTAHTSDHFWGVRC